MEREEFGKPACVISSTLIGMYKSKVLLYMQIHTLMHLNNFVHIQMHMRFLGLANAMF